jgi:hypothetical protein
LPYFVCPILQNMNKALFQKVLPHVIAIATFLIIAVVYCGPALKGMVLNQSDVVQFEGAIKGAEEYRAKHDGNYPMWTNNLFSGMPMFQIGGHGYNFVAGYSHLILTLGLPKPIGFFFLACISFYFLAVVALRLNAWLGILGSLAFAYATYNPVIVAVGHDTKMWSICYMPALLGSVMLIYDKRYWLGTAMTALTTSLMIAQNHVQIAYYTFLVIGVMTIFLIVRAIQNKDIKHLLLAGGLALVGIITGVATNAKALMGTYEYQKYTIRGGPSELTDTTRKAPVNQTGLDKDYAFNYSTLIPEPLMMMVPRIYGGSSDQQEVEPEKSKAIEALQQLPQQLQQQLPLKYYWGGSADLGAVGSSGPQYVGAIICFLAILAMFVLDSKYKWWMAISVVLAIMMSWGKNFEEFNTIFYDYFPFYNKFRAPTMILVIPQLLLPVLAILGVNAVVNQADKKLLMAQFKKALIASAVVFVVLFLVYSSMDFLSAVDKYIMRNVNSQNQPQLSQSVDSFYDGLKEDRETLFLNDIWRTLGFVLVGAAFIFLLIRKTINPMLGFVGLTIFCLIDLFTVNVKYLKTSSYMEPENNTVYFQKTAADNAILADTSFFRVFNVGDITENFTSYYYNSVGGYHAAKLRIYQDLIERHLNARPNLSVLNMLNAKYFIQKDRNMNTQNYQANPEALGNAWFVNEIKYVKTADEEMRSLDSFNAKQTAFVRETFKSSLPANLTPDSAGTVKLIKNDNDIITYTSQAAGDQFAVFSEVYYPGGWKAYIDNKEVPIVRVNYVLRGLAVPAGNHSIVFRFEPEGYFTGKKLTTIFSWLLFAMIAAVVFMSWRQKRVM